MGWQLLGSNGVHTCICVCERVPASQGWVRSCRYPADRDAMLQSPLSLPSREHHMTSWSHLRQSESRWEAWLCLPVLWLQQLEGLVAKLLPMHLSFPVSWPTAPSSFTATSLKLNYSWFHAHRLALHMLSTFTGISFFSWLQGKILFILQTDSWVTLSRKDSFFSQCHM